jgi:hypothetical protein
LRHFTEDQIRYGVVAVLAGITRLNRFKNASEQEKSYEY